ncbi:MAG: hypothetical protein H0X25_19595, partial [Acidobacteriales bacterium]|nr:hypothetical protein [Terriglobales bacterium]
MTPLDPATLTESERKFGRSPRLDPSVEYQPGIILMEQGDKAIRSIGSDGMTWTFDANAPHVKEFQLGKIVFATGRAVGRIIMLKPQGDTVAVILGPIQLTDVIRNGNFAMDAPLDMDKMIPYISADFPQPQDPADQDKKTNLSQREDEWKGWNKTVVVSRITRQGKWIPTAMTRTFADGHQENYERLGHHWSSVALTPALYSPSTSPVRIGQPQLRTAAWNPEPMSAAIQGIPLPGVPGVRLPGPLQVPDLNIPAPSSVPDLTIEGGSTRTIGSIRSVGVQYIYDKDGVFVKATGLLEFEGAHIRFFLKIADGKVPTSCGMDLMGA